MTPSPRWIPLTALLTLAFTGASAEAGFMLVNSPTQLTITDTVSWSQLPHSGAISTPTTLTSSNGVSVTLEQSVSSRYGGSGGLELGPSFDASVWSLVSYSFGQTASTLDIKLGKPVQAFGMELSAGTNLYDPLSRETVVVQALGADGSALPGASFGTYIDPVGYFGIASDRTNIYGVELVLHEYSTRLDDQGATRLHPLDLAGGPAAATPEPSSLILLGIGAAGLLAFARSRAWPRSRGADDAAEGRDLVGL